MVDLSNEGPLQLIILVEKNLIFCRVPWGYLEHGVTWNNGGVS